MAALDRADRVLVVAGTEVCGVFPLEPIANNPVSCGLPRFNSLTSSRIALTQYSHQLVVAVIYTEALPALLVAVAAVVIYAAAAKLGEQVAPVTIVPHLEGNTLAADVLTDQAAE